MDPYKSPAEQNVDSYQSDKTERKDLDGLGGWLILVGIGVVLSPIRYLVGVSVWWLVCLCVCLCVRFLIL